MASDVSDLTTAMARIKVLEDEVSAGDRLIEQYTALGNEFQCQAHGPCVPHLRELLAYNAGRPTGAHGYVLAPIPMVMWCPKCGARHIDKGEFATKPHHTHACQACGLAWRPAIVATVGVQFLPGFKDEVAELAAGAHLGARP